jgi:hypothetical protein
VVVSDAPADGAATHSDELTRSDALGGLRAGRLANVARPAPTGTFALFLDDTSMDDLWLAVTWGG